jgi:hypothetical protein
MRMHTRPNLFVVGAMKAGTTSMYGLLASHPEIFMSRVKEPHYFSTDIDPTRFDSAHAPDAVDVDALVREATGRTVHQVWIRDPALYLSLFAPGAPKRWRGEASPSYLYSKVAASNIRDFAPDSRIIVMLRDPIERAFSQYRMDAAIGRTRLSFLDAVTHDRMHPERGWGERALYVDLGLYADQVARFTQAFSPDQIRVYLIEDLERITWLADDLGRFLGVDPACFSGIAKENAAMQTRWGSLNNVLHRSGLKRIMRRLVPRPLVDAGKRLYYTDARGTDVPTDAERVLREAYREDVSRVARLIDRDLRSWRTLR